MVNWNELREFNGSVEKAFEELCCQLFYAERPELLATFRRKGTPDAGVECFWTIPNGDEHGLQAKYFLSPPNTGQWSQIDDSVGTAISKHPKLSRYVIWLPIDMPDARNPGQESMLAKWEVHRKKWLGWLKKGRKKVEFEYRGLHEIVERLSRAEHAGRRRFWFSANEMNSDWYSKHISDSIKALGDRYFSKAHVDLPELQNIFDALTLTLPFFRLLSESVQDLSNDLNHLSREFSRKKCPKEIKSLIAVGEKIESRIREIVVDNIDVQFESDPLSCSVGLESVLEEARKVNSKVQEFLDREREYDEAGKKPVKQPREFPLRTYVARLSRAFFEIDQILLGESGEVARKRCLLIIGHAGMGKSHLFARIAELRKNDELPTIFLLGEQIDAGLALGSQVVKTLDLKGTFDEVLAEISASAQSRGRRALILIDALNESNNRKHWTSSLPALVEQVHRYPWITLAVSVREHYEPDVLGDEFNGDLWTRIYHSGFTDHEADAADAYFSHFGISPNIPLLDPVFSNGLFLRLYCKAIQGADSSEIAIAHQGIRKIFGKFLEQVDNRLSRKVLNSDPKERLVQRAVKSLASVMAEKGENWLKYDESKAIVDQFLPNRTWPESLFRHLLSEEVLAEDKVWHGDDYVDTIRFSFDRFGDLLIADATLEKLSSESDLLAAFGPDAVLGKKLLGRNSNSLIDGLSVALPEDHGIELIDVAQFVSERSGSWDSLVQSLVWRQHSAFTERTLAIVSNALEHAEPRSDVLDTLLSVASVPGHPLNANFLDRYLRNLTMPMRDAVWSTYLHHDWSRKSPISRLIKWGLSESSKTASSDSRHLAGVALVWSFTTSHRFVRDRATKAMVNLFDGRLDDFILLLRQFYEVDDLYLLERLYAVCCGIVLRSRNREAVSHVASEVYRLVFAQQSPPEHILLRDYARLVVEWCIELGAGDEFDKRLIRPPYASEPLDESLSFDTFEVEIDKNEYSSFYNSLSGMGDFRRYVIGDAHIGKVNGWVKNKTDAFSPARPEELDPEAAEAWRALTDEVVNSQPSMSRRNLKNDLADITKDEDVVLARIASEIDAKLKRLGPDLQFRIERLLDDRKSYDDNRAAADKRYEDATLDQGFAVRWIFQRVKSLGWTPELFGKFDRNYRSVDNSQGRHWGRESHKPERIGKKYQWIAFHELLARITDHRRFRRSYAADPSVFVGAWSIDFIRDIDPTSLIEKPDRDRDDVVPQTWWIPLNHQAWLPDCSTEEWLHRERDVPKIEDALVSVDPYGQKWIMIDGYVAWQKQKRDDHDLSGEQRRISGLIWGYLTQSKDSGQFLNWARQQDFMGRWMPESRDSFSQPYWRELFWSPAYLETFNDESSHVNFDAVEKFRRTFKTEIPCRIVSASAEFSWERGSGFDCSGETSVSFSMPGEFLIRKLGLAPGDREGEFITSEGKMMFQDPSVHLPGPSCLMARYDLFVEFLQRSKLSIVWTVLLERMATFGVASERGGLTWVNGAFRLFRHRIEGGIESHPRKIAR